MKPSAVALRRAAEWCREYEGEPEDPAMDDMEAAAAFLDAHAEKQEQADLRRRLERKARQMYPNADPARIKKAVRNLLAKQRKPGTR